MLRFPNHNPTCSLNRGGEWCNCKETGEVIRDAKITKLEKLLSEYLSYGSTDGNPKRQLLRQELKQLCDNSPSTSEQDEPHYEMNNGIYEQVHADPVPVFTKRPESLLEEATGDDHLRKQARQRKGLDPFAR